jgi:hypothetical protein
LLIGTLLAVLGLAVEVAGATPWLLNTVLGTLISTGYFTVFEWRLGATPGKLLLRQRVVQADGTACRLWPAFVRGLWRIADGVVFGMVAYSYMKRSPLHQRLGDRKAQTLVVSSRDPFIRQHRPWHGFVVAALLFGMIEVAADGALLLGSGQIVRAGELYAQLPAAALNLTAAELGSQFTLEAESQVDRPATDIRESSDRLFSGREVVVRTRVLVIDFYLSDTESDLSAFAQQWTRVEVLDAGRFLSEGGAGCGRSSSLQSFATANVGQQGYVLVLAKRNVLAAVLAVGPDGAVTPNNVGDWACTIAERIR